MDTALSEKLQLDSDLTLKKAMTSACQREMVRNQQMFLTNQDQPVEIKVIESVKKRMNSKSRPQHPKHHSTVLQSCAWCGKRHSHGREYCPAKSLVCVTNVKKNVGIFKPYVDLDPKLLEQLEEMNHQFLWELSMVMWKQLTFPAILGM